MTLASGQFSASAKWSLTKTNTGLTNTEQDGQPSCSITMASEQLFAAVYTIASGANQVIDLRSFTNLVGESVTGTKLYGLMLKVAGTGAKVKLEEGASDGLTLSPLLAGTTPSLQVSTTGFIAIGSDANPITIDATHKNIKVSNTGSASGTITVVAWIGTS